MTYEALIAGTARIQKRRAEAHGNDAEQERCNRLLDKLYMLRRIMLVQRAQNKKNS